MLTEVVGCCLAGHSELWSYTEQVVLFRFLSLNMSKFHSELTQREQDLLKIRRDSDTKAAELVKMEKMLEQTKNLFDKKTESGSDSMGYQENMGLYHKQNILTLHFKFPKISCWWLC